MSHVVSSAAICTDLECLKATLKLFPKLQWVEGKKRFAWYGKWMDDYSATDAAYRNGISPEEYGKCDHVIKLEGNNYEIGVVKRKDGKGWSLVWDFYSDGRNINAYIGDSAEKLMVAYNKTFLERFAEAENRPCDVVSDTADELVMEITERSY